MKIAMLIARFPPDIGGAEIQCYRLSRWLARNGHRVVVLTERSSPELARREQMDALEIIRFGTRGRPPWSSFFYGVQAFFWLLRQARLDLLHAHMIASPAMVASLASFFLRTPALVKVTGGRLTGDLATSKRSALGRIKLWLFMWLNPYVVCPSPETFQEAKSFGIPAEKLSYIPNGVDIEHFRPSPLPNLALRMPYQIPTEALLAIYVGRWAKGKGVETLLDLWEAGVCQPEFPWQLMMVLSEQPPEAISERIRRLKGKVHTAIGIPDPVPYYRAGDLAILLSDGEGLSNFLLEAMACGLPTLTTGAAALPDARGDETGTQTLSPGGQTVQEALAFLTDIAGHRERLTRRGQASRRHVEKNYALDQIGRSYVSLYERMKK